MNALKHKTAPFTDLQSAFPALRLGLAVGFISLVIASNTGFASETAVAGEENTNTPSTTDITLELAEKDYRLPGLQSPSANAKKGIQQDFDKLQASIAANKPEQALKRAKALVKKQPKSVAMAYNLGLIHYRQQQWPDAIASWEKAVTLAEASGNFRDPRLAAPLFALGTVQAQLENHSQALELLQRAAFISRSHFGLQSLEQLAHDKVLIDTLLAAGQIGEAYKRLEAQLSIYEQRQQPLELDSHRRQVAEQLQSIGLLRNALNLHEERLRDRNKEAGPEELASIHQDIAIAQRALYDPKQEERAGINSTGPNPPRVYYNNNGNIVVLRERKDPFEQLNSLNAPSNQGSYHLKQAQKQQRKADSNATEQAETLVLLGDHYQATGKARLAKRQYQKAEDLLLEAGQDSLISHYFNAPVLVWQPVLKAGATAKADERIGFQGQAKLIATISEKGGPKNVELLSIYPSDAEYLRKRIVRLAKKAEFRPRREQGEPQATKDFEFIVHFQYLPKKR